MMNSKKNIISSVLEKSEWKIHRNLELFEFDQGEDAIRSKKA